MITPELTKRIEEAAHKYWGDTAEMEDDPFIKGANFGYNLCAEEKDAEIEMIEALKNSYRDQNAKLYSQNIDQQSKISTLEFALKVACEALEAIDLEREKGNFNSDEASIALVAIAKLRGSV